MLTDQEKAELAELQKLSTAAVLSSVSGRAQADAALKMLEVNGGTVTTAHLATINPNYPSDPIYYARRLYGVKIATHRARGKKTTYTLVMGASQVKRLAELEAKAAEPQAKAATAK